MRLFFIPFYILSLGIGLVAAAEQGLGRGLPVWGGFSGEDGEGGEEESFIYEDDGRGSNDSEDKDIIAINAAWNLAVKNLLEHGCGIVPAVKNTFTVRFVSWPKKDFSFGNIVNLSQGAPQHCVVTIIVDEDGAVHLTLNIPRLINPTSPPHVVDTCIEGV